MCRNFGKVSNGALAIYNELTEGFDKYLQAGFVISFFEREMFVDFCVKIGLGFLTVKSMIGGGHS